MKKRTLISFVLSLALLFTNVSFVYADDTTKITIIHTNDTHGRVLVEDGGFGFGKIATIAKEAKKNNPNTLLVDAGDTLHGMPIINISKGKNAVKILNAAGYDYMVPGNHDFNYGSDRLKELSKEAEFKILSANLFDKSGKALFRTYKIVEMDGINVGIFGLCTPETAYKTSPSNVKDVEFKDPIEVSKKMVRELDDKTDVIVALTHMGVDESSTVTLKEVAHYNNLKNPDLIFPGDKIKIQHN